MLSAKSWVLDRIEQSFSVFIKHPIALVIPLSIFQIIMIELIPALSVSIIFWGNLIDTMSINSLFYIAISLALIYALFYVVLLIPVTLGIIKWASDILHGKTVYLKEVLFYGFSKIFDAFRVYWFLFAYAYLIPALCFIFAWCILLSGLFLDNDLISYIGWWLMIASSVYALIQWIYRGIKWSFWIAWAIYENDFSKQQFIASVQYTNGNWWRIVWNYLLLWVMSALVMGIFWWIIWAVWFIWNDSINMFSSANEINSWTLEQFIWNLWNFSVFIFIINSISQILGSIVSAFVIVFSLILYLRLKDEAIDWKKVHHKVETIWQEKPQKYEL